MNESPDTSGGPQPQPATTQPARRRRDRRQTESDLFAAVGELLARDGVLAGISLQEVADEARVNRGQIYQMFGSRQGLLRAALAALMAEQEPDRTAMRSRPFRERRRQMFESMVQRPDLVGIEALLALDGDQDVQVLPEFALTLEDLARDVADGHLPADADLHATHVATAALYMGYCVFRDVFARDTEQPVDELDARVLAVYDAMLNGITQHVRRSEDPPN